jgi:hypothetical protein
MGKKETKKGENNAFSKKLNEMSTSGLNISFWISKNDNGCGLTNVQMLWKTHKTLSSKSLEFIDTCATSILGWPMLVK